MLVLLLGSGAREHAIAIRLVGEGHEVVVAPGNAGIARTARVAAVDPLDGAAVSALALELPADLLVVGPEAPLIAGVADAVRARGVPVFGPSAAAAALEGSKAFAKRVMADARVPTGAAITAATLAEAEGALDRVGSPYVVKADGLAAGKGVLVTEDRGAAVAHARTWLEHGPVLVEEHLRGREVSLFFVCDGTRVAPLSPAADFKRLGDGDTGPNTGGMGAYSPLPWLAEAFGSEADFVREVRERVAQPVVDRLQAEETPFVGLLYCGLVVDGRDIRVIEFNARFGDPETQVVLPRLATPLGDLLLAAARGRLTDAPEPGFADTAAVTVVLASEGYPGPAELGRPLRGVDVAEATAGAHLAHAATAEVGGELVATGGRVVSAVGTGASIAAARDRAYAALEALDLEGGRSRSDIAAAAS